MGYARQHYGDKSTPEKIKLDDCVKRNFYISVRGESTFIHYLSEKEAESYIGNGYGALPVTKDYADFHYKNHTWGFIVTCGAIKALEK